MAKGSTWSKWDFHLHTPYSILNNNFGDPSKEETWDEYVNKIEEMAKENNIEAIGITDYFFIEGYKKLRSYQEQGRLKDIFIFPNIEFRVDKIIYRDKKTKNQGVPSNPKRLNFHVLFSPEISIEDIEEDFLGDLGFLYDQEPFGHANTKKLSMRNLERLGEKLKNDHYKFQEHSNLYIGCLNAIVKTDEIDDLLQKRFKGNYLLVLAEEDLSLMSWDSQDHATRKQLTKMSHAVFSSNEKTRDFLLGKNHPSPESYLNEFGHFKPCIWGCDSHGYEERFLIPDNKRYCWVKGDVTWEGLKQILFEPEDRVVIQPTNPETNKSIYTLDNLKIDKTKIRTNLEIDSVNFDLNSNLVTIIGGRGSGKTALLDLIASCFKEGKKLSSIKHSFFHRLYKDGKKQKTNESQPVPTYLTFKSTEEFKTEVGGVNGELFDKADITYLTQNHFEEYSANPDLLNEHIIDLIFEQLPKERQIYEEKKENIAELHDNLQKINLNIQQHKKYIDTNKTKINSSYKVKQGEKADYLERVKQKESQQDDSRLIQELTTRVNILERKKRDIENILNDLKDIKEHIEQLHQFYVSKVTEVNQKISKIFKEDSRIQLNPQLAYSQNPIDKISTLETSLIAKQKENSSEITQKKKSLEEMEGIDKEIAKLREYINAITEEIEKIEQEIEEIKRREKEIQDLDDERYELYKQIFQEFVSLKSYLKSMIDKFESGKSSLISNLRFEAVILVDTTDYLALLAGKLDNRQISPTVLGTKLEPIFDEIEKLLNANNQDITDSFVKQIQKIKKEASLITDKRKSSITYSDLYNAILKDIFSIGMNVYFTSFGKEKSLDALSMGERAIVLLKILLALDDKPLLIDQPEEHLDNRYIYEELKPAFRESKKHRQIIIATHNANLVVNTDAEQIIVAKCEDGILSYTTGTLEDVEIRENIKTILEGGDEAFKKREQRYGYIF